MDMRLIPMLALLYLLSFLDRKSSTDPMSTPILTVTPGGNIDNAKIEGLQDDLNMHDAEYNWCLTAFFFTYAAFEVPSNLYVTDSFQEFSMDRHGMLIRNGSILGS